MSYRCFVKRWVHPEVLPRRELDGSEKSDRIFLEPDVGVADGSQQAPLDVVETADIIDDLAAREIIEKSVDGEVPSECIFVGLAENVVTAYEEIVVVLRFWRVTTERGDFDDLAFAEEHVGESKASADDPAIPKELAELWRSRARGDIEVFWPAPQQQVADATPNEVSQVSMANQSPYNLHRVRIEVCQRYSTS